jgi:hypothetical protein
MKISQSKLIRVVGSSLLLAAAVFAVGCSDNSVSTQGGSGNVSQAPVVTASYPADGQTNVATASTISLQFDMPMDSLSVDHQFYFAGGSAMHDWIDSLDYYMGMGGMGGMHGHMMDMGHMMNWLDTIEISGSFHWNNAGDSCWFVPDSSLMADQDYMMFLYGDVESHTGMPMNMSGYPYGGYMVRFHTAP